MPIYTRTGDKGMTSMYGGKRVSKSSPQVEAYGSVDELTSYVGLLAAKLGNKKEKIFLTAIQKDLYTIMASLAGASQNLKGLENRVKTFEQEIDKIQSKLPKLHRFILPQGNEISSLFHILRAVCRRSERRVVETFLKEKKQTMDYKLILKYLNRLSDLFFSFARLHGKEKEILI